MALDDLIAWTDKGFANRDPRFDRASDTLRHHLPAGLEHWQKIDDHGYARTALAKVILKAVTDEDRDLILASLESAPFLIAAVTEHHWTEAARPPMAFTNPVIHQ